ncbi:MAG: class I SAM-dependent methyltransferase [Proteobacteria bacterium]|nr:class I SAM-dependent methyltransferase [Pseudomonadota bacterium]
MRNASKDDVKSFWQGRAHDEGLSNQVTHRDKWQRWLEIERIKQLLKSNDRVIDVGCGNGYTTRKISNFVGEIIGIDYSEEMISRAISEVAEDKKNKKNMISFAVCDITKLKPSHFGFFDMAISERCLINLEDWDEQKKAISNIAGVLKPGGYFLFIEGSSLGRSELNNFRKSVGLESMPPVWHNLDFDEHKLMKYLDRFFALEERFHFGMYDFIARVIHPLLVSPKEPKYNARINKIAATLALFHQEFSEISRTIFLVLKKL